MHKKTNRRGDRLTEDRVSYGRMGTIHVAVGISDYEKKESQCSQRRQEPMMGRKKKTHWKTWVGGRHTGKTAE